jgi:hypothetical protein
VSRGTPPTGEPVRSPVTKEHIELLQRFGRNARQKQLDDETRERFWELTCRMANLPHVEHAIVADAWRRFATATSDRSGVAIASDVDPQFVSIGITYDRKLFAGHTTSTRNTVARLLRIFSRCFPDKEVFLTEMHKICSTAWDERNR